MAQHAGAHAHHDPKAQRAEYFKVFKYLIVLTVVEVGFVFLPLPQLIITLLVVIASCAKAAVVGYYYMHLKQETKWLKFVALLPLIMFIYLAALGPDSATRLDSPYFFQPDRILPKPEHMEEAPNEGTTPTFAPVAGAQVREVIVKDGKEVSRGGNPQVAPPAAAGAESEWGAPSASNSGTSQPAAAAAATAPGVPPTASTPSAPAAAAQGGAADEWK